MNFNSIRNQLKFFLKFLRLVKLGVRIIANQSYWTKKKMVIQTRNETYTGNNYAVLCRIEKTSIFFCFLIEKTSIFLLSDRKIPLFKQYISISILVKILQHYKERVYPLPVRQRIFSRVQTKPVCRHRAPPHQTFTTDTNWRT